jgi:hypothetical protein
MRLVASLNFKIQLSVHQSKKSPSYLEAAMHTGIEGIPAEWIERREMLPEWALGET